MRAGRTVVRPVLGPGNDEKDRLIGRSFSLWNCLVVTLPRPSGAQWKLSPQAQLPCALGLSIVKPCFWMLSSKSIVAPSR